MTNAMGSEFGKKARCQSKPFIKVILARIRKIFHLRFRFPKQENVILAQDSYIVSSIIQIDAGYQPVSKY